MLCSIGALKRLIWPFLPGHRWRLSGALWVPLVARRAKQKMLTAVPGSFDPNFIERLSGRYAMTGIVRDRREALTAHCGGNPSYVQASLIKRTLWLELIVESMEQKFASGEPVDIGALTQAGNTLKGYYKDLGIAPTAKPTRRLHEHMAAAS
jgi:hypothetical protein